MGTGALFRVSAQRVLSLEEVSQQFETLHIDAVATLPRVAVVPRPWCFPGDTPLSSPVAPHSLTI
jgi:hypothetical protein